MRNLKSLVLLLLIPAAPVLVRSADAQGTTKPPNIVMIVSDDHAWTDYGFMGHPQIRTPHLDRLAAQSLCYRRGYVPSSLCCPSLASIISGQYPHQHKVTSNDPPAPADQAARGAQFQRSPAFQEGREVMNRFMDATPTLPRLLSERGYLSLQTGKWWQGEFRRGGFTHGMTRGARHGDEGLKIGRQTMQPIYDFIGEARQKERPFFVWYAPLLPHDPHNPPQRLLDKYKDRTPSETVAKYWAMVEWFDETCGQLMDHLDQQKLSDNTIVVYVTDNGWIQDPEKPRYAARSKQSPYDGGLRTPIMVRWPGKVKPRQANDLAMSIDLAPTLLKAVGLKPVKEMQGLDLLDEKAVSRRKTVHGECFTHNAVDLQKPASSLRWRWVIEGDWKLILPATQNEPDGKPELFKITEDPYEKLDLAGKEPEKVARLTQRLDAWWPAKL